MTKTTEAYGIIKKKSALGVEYAAGFEADNQFSNALLLATT